MPDRSRADASRPGHDAVSVSGQDPDPRPGAGPARVLVVDDTPQIRMLLRVNLALEGHHVEEAADGQGCLERLRRDPPVDVLVLDALMGPVDGWATTAAIRADPALEDLPVVMVTASVQAHHRARAVAVGVDLFVSKPFDPLDLVEAVAALVATGRPGRAGGGRGNPSRPRPTLEG